MAELAQIAFTFLMLFIGITVMATYRDWKNEGGADWVLLLGHLALIAVAVMVVKS